MIRVKKIQRRMWNNKKSDESSTITDTLFHVNQNDRGADKSTIKNNSKDRTNALQLYNFVIKKGNNPGDKIDKKTGKEIGRLTKLRQKILDSKKEINSLNMSKKVILHDVRILNKEKKNQIEYLDNKKPGRLMDQLNTLQSRISSAIKNNKNLVLKEQFHLRSIAHFLSVIKELKKISRKLEENNRGKLKAHEKTLAEITELCKDQKSLLRKIHLEEISLVKLIKQKKIVKGWHDVCKQKTQQIEKKFNENTLKLKMQKIDLIKVEDDSRSQIHLIKKKIGRQKNILNKVSGKVHALNAQVDQKRIILRDTINSYNQMKKKEKNLDLSIKIVNKKLAKSQIIKRSQKLEVDVNGGRIKNLNNEIRTLLRNKIIDSKEHNMILRKIELAKFDYNSIQNTIDEQKNLLESYNLRIEDSNNVLKALNGYTRIKGIDKLLKQGYLIVKSGDVSRLFELYDRIGIVYTQMNKNEKRDCYKKILRFREMILNLNNDK